MSRIKENLVHLKNSIPEDVTLVAVSKTKPISDLMEAYTAGQRVFGENKIQEMTQKWEEMPKDILWHMIGHVQTNKIKYMASYVNLIHAVDSIKLLKEINKQAQKHNRTIDCLLQLKIASEESKYGLTPEEVTLIMTSPEIETLHNVQIRGLMGMATFTENTSKIQQEFMVLKHTFDILSKTYPKLKILSMGMSGDFRTAIACGSTMVRIGSSIFGNRNYN